ncbi:zinc-ribbon domain-containing protein [Azoarcus sp. PA01]|nr:zinc-ribbon domain-containing protein [Azoarcus sp. PA01]
MFARCPACQTVFRVQPEQLRAHHGEVRCGRCYASFNALDRVLHVAPAASPPAAPASEPPAAAPPPRPESLVERDDRFFILDELRSAPDVTRQAADDRTGSGTAPAAAPAPAPAPAPGTGTGTGTGQDDETGIPQLDDFSDRLDFEIPETFLTSRPIAAQASVDSAQPSVDSAQPSVHSAQSWAWQHGHEASDEFVDRPQPRISVTGDGDRGEAEAAATFSPAPFEPPDQREPVLPRDGDFSATGETAAEDAPLPPLRRARTSAPKPLGPTAAAESATSAERQEDEAPTGSASFRPAAADAANDREHLDATYGSPASPAKRWLYGLGIGILLGALAVQSAFVFRDGITRKWPQLRPAYLAACGHLKCTLALPRVAGAISIEASELQSEPGRGARFVLNATIRNRAPHPQAYPHLELTLTDIQDQPLVRRVLGPAQWLPAGFLEPGSAEQRFDAGRDIAVQLPFEAPGVEASGYRVYAFYP